MCRTVPYRTGTVGLSTAVPRLLHTARNRYSTCKTAAVNKMAPHKVGGITYLHYMPFFPLILGNWAWEVQFVCLMFVLGCRVSPHVVQYVYFDVLFHVCYSIAHYLELDFFIFPLNFGILICINLYYFYCFGFHICIVFLPKHAGGLPLCYRYIWCL